MEQRVILTGQQQVDNYVIDHGHVGVQELELRGNIADLSGLDIIDNINLLRIEGIQASNLNGLTLNHLGALLIKDCPNLVDIKALSAGGLGYSGDRSLSRMRIQNNAQLASLEGMEFFGSHNSGFAIAVMYNPQLTDLKGLDNLTSTGQGFFIKGNTNLNSLHGLEGLRTVRNNLNIEEISNLTDISALDGLITAGINWGGVNIRNVGGLGDLSSAFPSLQRTHKIDFNSCDGLTHIPNYQPLEVSTADIELVIHIRNNPDLVSIEGFSSITKAGQIDINNNNKLTSLKGLENITSVTVGYIQTSNSGSGFSIANNGLLTDLDDLANLTDITGSLSIVNNVALKNLDGLAQVSSISQDFTLLGNTDLNNACGIISMLPSTSAGVIGGAFYVSNNTTNTNSEQEIIAYCLNLPVLEVVNCPSGPIDMNQVLRSSKFTFTTSNDAYIFEVTDGQNTFQINRPNRRLKMTHLIKAGHVILSNTTYNVRVSALVDGVQAPYGEYCTFQTGDIPSTEIEVCVANPLPKVLKNSTLKANSVPGVSGENRYAFEVTKDGAMIAEIIRLNRTLKLKHIENELGLTLETGVYEIRVAAIIGGAQGQYGPSSSFELVDFINHIETFETCQTAKSTTFRSEWQEFELGGSWAVDNFEFFGVIGADGNGTDWYIDNLDTCFSGGSSFTSLSSKQKFYFNSGWFFISENCSLIADGQVRISWYKNGNLLDSEVFELRAVSEGHSNGYVLLDFTQSGQSALKVDSVTFEPLGNLTYLALDDFAWSSKEITTNSARKSDVSDDLYEANESASISTYPNPVENKLTIRHEGLDVEKATILTVTGQKMKEFTLSESETTVDTSDLPQGIYLLKVSNTTIKFLK